jgi:hypothetical protein
MSCQEQLYTGINRKIPSPSHLLPAPPHCVLFRWYLNGTIETGLRGCTREQAESPCVGLSGESTSLKRTTTRNGQREGVAGSAVERATP